MSNAIFPSLPGIDWGMSKSPEWDTIIRKSSSGREIRATHYSYPIWRFRMQYTLLREIEGMKELQELVGFFNARRGSFESFLFEDTSDSQVTKQVVAIGDGVTRQFRLVRSFGGFTEPVASARNIQIFVNNERTGGFTLNDAVVTLMNPLPVGATLAWSGWFYYRCRFANDYTEYEQFLQDLWSAKKIELVTVKV